MTVSAADIEAYREQVSRWSQLLATGQLEGFQAELANPCGQGVRRHWGNSQGERRRIFWEALQFVALAFPDFDAVIDAHIQEVPRLPYDLDDSHEERFLRWLQISRPLTAKQADLVTYQLSEYAALAQARRQHEVYVQFQALPGRAESAAALEGHPEWRLHLNPTCVWARLAVLELASQAERTEVLFYGDGGGIKFLNLTPLQKTAVQALSEIAPCTIAEWGLQTSRTTAEDLIVLARELAGHRVLAVAA
jgi:hypothetical protein